MGEEVMKEECDERLDARYLACPLPVLKARKLLQGMAPRSVLEVLATDPAAKRDFVEFAATSGHVLLDASELDNGLFRFLLQRA